MASTGKAITTYVREFDVIVVPVVVVVVVVALLLAGAGCNGNVEPVYQGKTLSQWIELTRDPDVEASIRAFRALNQFSLEDPRVVAAIKDAIGKSSHATVAVAPSGLIIDEQATLAALTKVINLPIGHVYAPLIAEAFKGRPYEQRQKFAVEVRKARAAQKNQLAIDAFDELLTVLDAPATTIPVL